MRNRALRVTGGLGWGRLGAENGFDNPLRALDSYFETRPPNDFGEGGTIASDQFFRGDAAFFGGVEYRFSDSLTAVAEYSSDAYTRETDNGSFDNESPINVGLRYAPFPSLDLTLGFLKGSTLAFGGTITIDPTERAAYGGLDPAPLPVRVRDTQAAQSWESTPEKDAALRAGVAKALEQDGMRLVAMELDRRRVRVRFDNNRYRADAEAIGRASRILTQAMPDPIEIFELEVVREGLPLSQVTIRRSDMERLENEVGASELSYRNAGFEPAGSEAGLIEVPDERPRFNWGIKPYFGVEVFNAEDPAALSGGLEASASYRIQPSLVVDGAVRKRLFGDVAPSKSTEDAPIPVVRRDSDRYFDEGDPGLQRLTLTHYGRLAPDVFTRATVGYLERMYGGLSTEVLYRPVGSRTAYGAEVNYAKKRDYDLGFGFQDYDTVTAFGSVYHDFGNGFVGEIDAGRYLAGDWGATVSLEREFDNGWRLGAYATKTDVSAEDFGEGSYDKGLRLSVPLDALIGSPTRTTLDRSLSSLTRDGGARLNINGRLYDVVRDGRQSELEDGWGRFWR